MAGEKRGDLLMPGDAARAALRRNVRPMADGLQLMGGAPFSRLEGVELRGRRLQIFQLVEKYPKGILFCRCAGDRDKNFHEQNSAKICLYYFDRAFYLFLMAEYVKSNAIGL